MQSENQMQFLSVLVMAEYLEEETCSITDGASLLQELSADSIALLKTKQSELSFSIIDSCLRIIAKTSEDFHVDNRRLCAVAQKKIDRWWVAACLLGYKNVWNEDILETGLCKHCDSRVSRRNAPKHLYSFHKNVLGNAVEDKNVNAHLKAKFGRKNGVMDRQNIKRGVGIASKGISCSDPAPTFEQDVISDEMEDVLNDVGCEFLIEPDGFVVDLQGNPVVVDGGVDAGNNFTGNLNSLMLDGQALFDCPSTSTSLQPKKSVVKHAKSKINNVLNLMSQSRNKEIKNVIKIGKLQRACIKDQKTGQRTYEQYSVDKLWQSYQEFREFRKIEALSKRQKNVGKPKKLKLPSNILQTCNILVHLEACIMAQNEIRGQNELFNKFTRLSSTSLIRLLSDTCGTELNFSNDFKLFLLRCVTNIIFDIENSLITLANNAKSTIIKPLDLGTLFNISKELGDEVFSLPDDKIHKMCLPSNDRILRVMYQCLYISIKQRPQTVREILQRLLDQDPEICRIFKTKFSVGIIGEIKQIIYRFIVMLGNNIKSSPYREINLEIFKNIYDSVFYDFKFANVINKHLGREIAESNDFLACWLSNSK